MLLILCCTKTYGMTCLYFPQFLPRICAWKQRCIWYVETSLESLVLDKMSGMPGNMSNSLVRSRLYLRTIATTNATYQRFQRLLYFYASFSKGFL